ncbi:hypothetical protein F5Y17DRAFT_446120 [Xylariaceae sp. FL0594]|nr:hypothetical protein F5Y17DRAFT_446120 [Xylariaceae sp. FL0594]
MSSRRSEEDLAYGERWDQDRFLEERERERDRDRYHTRPSPQDPPRERSRQAPSERSFRQPPREMPRSRPREASVDERYFERRAPRPWEEERIRERRFFDDDDPPRRRPSPPPEVERRIYLGRERDREHRDPSPVRRPPVFLRRQSSLDTFDRRPAQRLYDRHEEYGPPARRGDYRPDPYEPIPLPRSRALPPPRIHAERDFEEIKISEPRRYGDDDFHEYPEHVHEREVVRTRRRRDRSASRTSRSRRGRSRSSSSSSSNSDSGGTTVTAKSEYPKKGKTRIPVRLVSIRAILELEYPYVIEGNTIIIQKALGQKNIDDLLRLSEEYKKADAELAAARSVPGAVVEERKDELFTIPPPAPPTVTRAPPPPPVEMVRDTMIREISPVRSHTSYTTSGYGTTTYGTSVGYTASSATTRPPIIVDAGPREYGDEVIAGPLAIVGDRRKEHRGERELVRAERLPTGELVLYEEEVERIEEPRRGVRIEKDKKGRMSISVPKFRR